MRKRTTFIFVLTVLLLAAFPAAAQDDFDISIPGEEVEVSVPAASSSAAPAEGTASSGEVNLLQMIKAGGWSMWVLGSFSFAVIGLMIYCIIDLQRKNFNPEEFASALVADMEAANLDAALQKSRGSANCLSTVMEGGMNFIADRGYEVLDSEGLKVEMAEASQTFNRGRVRTINYFSIIAQAAPMMGLLGTVSGMIGAFAKLSQGGTSNPSAFAGNISEALITTASGLVVALPAIFCYFIFRDRLQQLVAETDRNAKDLISTLRRTVVNYSE